MAIKDGSFNQLRLYVDGVLVNTVSAFYSAGFDSPSATMSIGWRDIANDESVFNGIIDEVAIYNIALDSTIIQQHYNNGLQNKGYCESLLAPAITSSAVVSGKVGQIYLYDVDAAGIPTPTFSLISFPIGMTIDTASGLIQWLPEDAGNFAVSVKAVNGVNPEATQSFFINVTQTQQDNAPAITSTAVTVGNTFQQYVYDVNASGAPAPKYSLIVKPLGMEIDSISGIIQWSPADFGSYNVTVRANNGILPNAEQSFTINVELATIPNITSIPDTIAIITQQHVDTVKASGYPAPKYYLITKPVGMLIDSISGRIEWTPDSLGIYQVEVSAKNIWGEDTLKYNIEVQGIAPTITSTAMIYAYKTQLYIYDVNATGIPAPKYYLEVKTNGMIVDSISGIIQWTPSDSGSYSVTVKASNNYGMPAIQSFVIHVTDLTNCPDNIISYWKLNEVSGSKYRDLYNIHDAEAGRYAPTPVAGKSKGGQRFDGINDEINIPVSDDFDFGANDNFAIEFWIKRTYPVLKRDADIVIGRTDSGTLMRWWVGLNNTSKATFQLRSKTGETYSVTGATAISDSNWHHIVAVRDGVLNQLRIFTDGKLDGTVSASYSNGFDSPTAEITLGWLSIGLENTFYGTIDEVAIYNDVVDSLTVERHYVGGLYKKDYCDQFLFANVKLFLEGVYDSTINQMRTTINSLIPLTSPYSQDPRTVDSIPSSIIDWVLLELYSNAVGSADVVKSVFLHKNGNIVMDDGITPNSIFELESGSYYFVIKHRNTIETWSTIKLQFDSSIIYYDFTMDSSKAYGNNLVLKGSKWCIYSGDINQDGIVDLSDLSSVDNDNYLFVTGYTVTDANGDGIVDLTDLEIVDSNTLTYVSKVTPVEKALKNALTKNYLNKNVEKAKR